MEKFINHQRWENQTTTALNFRLDGGDGKPSRIGTEGSANHPHAVFLELFVGRDNGQPV